MPALPTSRQYSALLLCLALALFASARVGLPVAEGHQLLGLAAPTLTSPADGATLSTFGPRLEWNAPAGMTQYHLQVVPAKNDGPAIDMHVGLAETSFQIPEPPQWYGLLPGMTYAWRLRVSDAPSFVDPADASWSPWSAQRTFRTPARTSAGLRSVSPADGATVASADSLPLQWSNADSDIFYYEIQVSGDPTFSTNPATATSFVWHNLVHGGVAAPQNSWRTPPLQPGATYYWRLRPRVQGDGAPVMWSSTWSFRTPGPSVVFPPDGVASKLVVAQYYAWYDSDNWDAGITSDTPRDRYSSDDIAAIRRHAQQARDAGIDGLAVSWLGPGDRTDSNLHKLLDEGAKVGLWATITFETDKPMFASQASVVAGLKYATNLAAARPNWLRSQGKPVFFFWRPESVALLPGQTPLSAWASIRDQVDHNRQAIWIMEGLAFDLLEVFDGQFGYSIAWSSNVYYTLSSWAAKVHTKAEALGQAKLVVSTVMPGNDDTRTGRPDGFVRDREGGAYFARTWDAAMQAGADWVNITSFNEWIEGTQIEPSVSYGDLYLNISKEWSTNFKK